MSYPSYQTHVGRIHNDNKVSFFILLPGYPMGPMPEEKTAPERGGNIIEKRMASKSPGLFSHPHGIAMSSFSPPANDAITLRLALLNACLAPCAGRAESVYHIIDGTGKETVRN